MTQRVTQAVVISGGKMDPSVESLQLALFGTDGDAYSPGTQTGNTLLMTGYAAHAAGNVAATDTADVAIAKLEARIAALEAA